MPTRPLFPAASFRASRRGLVAASIALACTLAGGAAVADVLDDVQKAGVLRVAVTLDYPPFGSIDASMKPQGYDVEFADKIASALGVKAELVRVTAPSKIPTIVTRKADLLLNIGFNEERAKAVDFSQPYAPYHVGVYGPPDLKIKDVAGISGKKIAVTRGTIEDQLITKSAPTDANILRFEDHSNTISAYLSGQADLISIGNIVAAALIEKKPARLPEQKFLLMDSPVRSAVGKGETRLLAKVNEAIAQIKQSGQLNTLATVWLKQPLPAGF